MDDVIKLHKRQRPADPDRTLKRVDHSRCFHNRFLIDEKKSEVECGDCGEKLNPMWVLGQLCNKESNLARIRDGLFQKVKELRGRLKYKCGYCGKMNDVSKTLRFRVQDE